MQKGLNQTKKKGKDPKEIVEEIPEPLPSTMQKLHLDPESLMGVASAYRYKLTVLNPEMEKCAFYFDDSLDVFGFNDVNKKRALKKQDWPSDAPLDHPRRYNVKIQLLAGSAEIKSCGGCSMWKEMTKKPFLILTPHGSRCVEYSKNPFILLIFRCCPKFHSYTKQFSLRITVSHNNFDIIYGTEVIIHRKKMNTPTKKRKSSAMNEEEEDDEVEPPEDDQEPSSPPCQQQSEKSSSGPQDKKPRLLSLLDPVTHRNLAQMPVGNSNLPNVLTHESNFENLESVLALHQNLFPQDSTLFNYDFDDCSSYSFESLKPIKQTKASKPFHQTKGLQEEYEIVNAHYEQGQPAPQQWANPQQFFDFLNSKPSKPTPIPPNNLKNPKKLIPPPPLFFEPSDFLIPNDEKWLTSVLDDVPFSNDLFRFDDTFSLFPFE